MSQDQSTRRSFRFRLRLLSLQWSYLMRDPYDLDYAKRLEAEFDRLMANG